MKLTLGIAALLGVAAAGWCQSLNGLWDAAVRYDDFRIPFTMEFAGTGSKASASFFNGDERVTSTSGKVDGHTVIFRFDDYATELSATLEDGVLKGTYSGKRIGIHEFEARPHHETAAAPGNVPRIAGVWDVPTESGKGERAWHLIVRQSGAEVSAAILRVDGDTGALTGHFQDGKFALSHFDGARPATLDIAPQPDGTLALTLQNPRRPPRHLVAVLTAEARKKGMPAPDDPAEHTSWKDPSQPFAFRFPDLDGHVVSNTDPRFANKVVLVNITGSWCPNCHDETPFLVELYRKYHSLGLEIVALDFEEAEQLASQTRPRAFRKKYGIEYPYLIAGEPKDVHEKIPEAENLDAWPTTFFLGRDGRVRAVHAGFAAKASGEFHDQLKREVTTLVERLLAETPATALAAR